MSKHRREVPVLDEAHAAFLQGRVSINAASCDVAGVPSMVRAFGCRVSADRRAVTVFLASHASSTLLRDLRAGSPIAVVFSRPLTHETLQLKGTNASIGPLDDGDRIVMQVYGKGLSEEIRQLGYGEPFASALTAAVNDEAVAVTFTPTAVFQQTPGPNAGRRLETKP